MMLAQFHEKSPALSCWARWLEEKTANIPYPEKYISTIQDAASQGYLVFVHRSRSIVWHIALRAALKNAGLPYANDVFGLNTRFEKPLFGLLSPSCHKEDNVKASLLNHGYIEFFLHSPATILSTKRTFTNILKELIDLQKQIEKPIFLLPHLLIYGVAPPSFELTTADLVFGSSSEPGFFRSLSRVLWRAPSTRWETTELVNLKTFVQENASLSSERLAQVLRRQLTIELARMDRALHGSPRKSRDRMRKETLQGKYLTQFLNKIHEENGISIERLRKKAVKYYNEIAGNLDVDILRVADWFLKTVWNRIYDGLHYREADFKKIREAAKRGPLIIVPSHRSHVDYLVMSQLLYRHGLLPPYIAAGINLSFFPIGNIFRRGGAFFIRRTFKGDPLYPHVVKAYVNKLLHEGLSLEFFIEGGRSRTGKTLIPKTGLLSIIMDCYKNGQLKDMAFIPSSISYEKLVEAKSYHDELQGKEKEAENAKDLVQSAQVLTKRYGKVFVNIDEPIFIRDFLFERGLVPEQIDDNLIKTIAYRIVFGINRSTIVTPQALIATALLASPHRVLNRNSLLKIGKRLLCHIQQSAGEHARIDAGILADFEGATDRALEFLLADKLISKKSLPKATYHVNPKTIVSLDYYKNNLIHHFVSETIFANALLSHDGLRKPVLLTDLLKSTQQLSRLFKFEFIFPVEHSYIHGFERVLHHAAEQELIVQQQDMIMASSSQMAQDTWLFLAKLSKNFINGYQICANFLLKDKKNLGSKKHIINTLLKHLHDEIKNGAILTQESANKNLVENFVQYCLDASILKQSQDTLVIADLQKLQTVVNLLTQ